MTLLAGRGYRDVVLAAIALVQCYATRTQNGCAPLSYHATMAECRVLAEDYQRFDCRRWSATAVSRLAGNQGLPVVEAVVQLGVGLCAAPCGRRALRTAVGWC